MFKAVIVFITLLISMLWASPVVKTGQTKSYDQYNHIVTNGSVKDDGYYQTGTDFYYTRNNIGIVIDNVTSLEWDDSFIVRRTWNDAIVHCNALTLDGGGWRLPTVRELETLVNYDECCPSMDTVVFQNITLGNYRTSTTYENDSSKAWIVRFQNWGYSSPELKDWEVDDGGSSYWVRCVRGETYEDPNFYRSDDIVHDLATGLEWQDNTDAKTIKKNWIEAINYCEALTLGSYTDWRLPNQKELLTINDRSRYNPTIDSTVFQNIDPSTASYWSSTTRILHPETIDAWHVHFMIGYNYYDRKATFRNVRCVRGESAIPGNIPPTADAGADKAVQVNNTITITGSGTDPDGTIVSYEWKKGTTVLATTASFDYTPTVVGTDTLTLTVTDDDGEPGTDSMDVIVTEDPPPPPNVLYEAEDAEMSSAFAISSAHSGYTGTGYVDYAGEGYVKWTVELATEGNYDLVFRYALGSGNRPLHISVDSTSGGSTIDFPATGGWSTWGETRTTVSLTAGTHTIYASTTGLSGANVDHLSIEDATGTPPPNTPPTANAGADKAVQVNNTITITGSGTDPDGTIASYEWSKDGTVLATTASFDYTPTVVGTDTLTLTVTDDDGAPGTDSMDVIVTEDPPPNIPPTANAGPDKSVQVNQSVTITGSGTDPDGTIVSYEWKKGTTVLATTASFDYTPTVVGTDTLTLTVTDDDGAPGTDSMDVIVTEDTPPPPSTLYEAEDAEMSPAFAISSAHSGYTGTGYVDYTGEGYVKWTVELAAEGNYDLVFRYALGSGNRPLHISVDSTSGGSTIDFPATGGWSTWGETRTTVSLTAGTHTIYASTTGLSGANVDHLSIEDATGTPPPNTPPTADAGADKAVQVNNTITITGSGTDPDGTIVSYEWKKGTTVLATTASFDYTPTVVGTDTLTLTVTDDDGEPGTDSMDVIVTEDPPPPPSTLYEAEDAEMSPAFAISSAHSGYTGTGYVDYTGEGYVKWTVELAAEGNYDLVFRYALGSGNRPLHISVDSTSGGSTIDFPATGGWSTWGETRTTVSLTAGTHTIYASTTGLSGANVDHLSIEDATGTPPPNTPPTADAGADKAVQVNNTITITGSGTDPDGTIASYEWSKDGTVLATTASFDYTPTVVGTDTLTLTVTDDDGAPGTDSMDVIVTEDPPPNIPPTANAGPDKSVQVNQSVTITGSGTDPDGTIVSYEWKKGTTVLATTASFDYTPTVVGTDTLTLTVTDDDGAPGTDSMDVIVTEDTPPPPSTLYEAEDAEMSPAFAISSAHSGYTGTGYVDYTGEGYVKWTVELAAEGNYDLVFRYALGSGNRPLHISVDSTSGGSTIDFPATGGWSTWGETRTTVSLTAGTHTIYASTTGLSGANVDHLSIEDATGTPPPNTPPTADAGADKAVQVNNTITITGSGTDPDGTIASYEWSKDGTVLATTASFDYTPTVVGTDTLTLTVTDDDGAPGTDSMDVIVTEDPPPPPVGFPVGKTGQTTIYLSGDDGYYRFGQDRNYLNNGNGTVTDTMLQVIWQNDYNDNKGYASNDTIPNLSKTSAEAYCNEIDLAGCTDWRLPTRLELASLVEYSKSRPGPVIDDVFITATVDIDYGMYWTGTDDASDTTQAWFVRFGWGDTNRKPKTDTYNVRCVRGDN
ncbi:PKD domain-containing protein [Sulfurovum sp. CS9]|uniref:PKD domain-containing protein n=1 Tax=Sulfurovum sp. CS9 TaxID=3391146 RepID=UPI0039ED1FD1